MKTSILLSVILLLINIAEPNPTENDPFSSIIILNLDRRPDRWEQTRNELVLANVESFERLSAVDGLALSQQEIDRFNVSARAARGRKVLPGQVGCALSHARVMSEIVSRNLSAVLVLEDDVTFVPNFLSRLEYAMSIISKDWELLFLGSSGCIVDESDENLVVARARNCWTTHAYAIRSPNVARRILEAHETRLLPADTLLVELQKELRSYTCRPALVYQRVGPSDIATFNRGHLGLGHPLYSSDRVIQVWAASELKAPLSFPDMYLKDLNMSTISLHSFYAKSSNDSTIRYYDEDKIISFEHAEEYFKHRIAHGFPGDWSEL